MEIATRLPTVTSAVLQNQLETATSSAVNAPLAVIIHHRRSAGLNPLAPFFHDHTHVLNINFCYEKVNLLILT